MHGNFETKYNQNIHSQEKNVAIDSNFSAIRKLYDQRFLFYLGY